MSLGRITISFLIAAVLTPSGCRHSSKQIAPEESQQVFTNLSLNQTDAGSAVWKLKTASAAIDKNKNIAHLQFPRMTFYKNGRVTSTLFSDTGILQTQSQNLHLEGHVVAKSLQDNTVLNTEALDYSSATKKFTTNRAVTLTRPSGIVHGLGLEANSYFSQIRIFHQNAVIKGGKG